MTMYSDNYYIITEDVNGLIKCLQSYKDIERAKQQAKQISEGLNITCLIVKPTAKVISNTQWIIEDLN